MTTATPIRMDGNLLYPLTGPQAEGPPASLAGHLLACGGTGLHPPIGPLWAGAASVGQTAILPNCCATCPPSCAESGRNAAMTHLPPPLT